MKENSNHTKVFGIGLNKTGTTTLGECGRILGYRYTTASSAFRKELLEDIVLRKDFTRIKQEVRQYDLFEDWPWPLIYQELDRLFPGSKFILTVRKNEIVWLNSLKRHSMTTHPTQHHRKLAYGYNFPHRREREHIDFYIRHNSEVRTYFSDRVNDFLEICWENGDGFEKLCKFLGKDIPDVPLPHKNKGAGRKVSKKRYLLNKLLSFSGG